MKRQESVYALLKTFPAEALKGDSVEVETPARVAKMWDELLKGYSEDPQAILHKTFSVDGSDGGIVCVKDIPFYSCCEHHLVPFFGTASIAYLPHERAVGLSKLARLVECYARRLQVQERMTKQIADAIRGHLDAEGVLVVIKAEHMCMTMRGIQKPGTQTVTSRCYGTFRESDGARAEAMRLLDL